MRFIKVPVCNRYLIKAVNKGAYNSVLERRLTKIHNGT